MSTTTTDLRARAVTAAQAEIAENDRRDAESQANARASTRDALVTRLRDWLQIEVAPEDVELGVAPEAARWGRHETVARVSVDGIVFSCTYSSGGITAEIPCADCDQGSTTSLSRHAAVHDLGYLLLAEHTHKFRDESTHPNAPTGKPFVPIAPVAPTIADELEQLIRRIVLDELREVEP